MQDPCHLGLPELLTRAHVPGNLRIAKGVKLHPFGSARGSGFKVQVHDGGLRGMICNLLRNFVSLEGPCQLQTQHYSQ